MKLMLLEYHEGRGNWHYNMVNPETLCPQSQPDSNDWATIALTTEEKARVFTNMLDCKIHKREFFGNKPYTVEYVKKEWKLFCYMFNDIIQTIEITPELKQLTNAKFNSATALARLGNGHFTDLREDEELDWAWEYDPLNFLDSNF